MRMVSFFRQLLKRSIKAVSSESRGLQEAIDSAEITSVAVGQRVVCSTEDYIEYAATDDVLITMRVKRTPAINSIIRQWRITIMNLKQQGGEWAKGGGRG